MGNMLFVVNPRSGKAHIKNRLLGILDRFIKVGWEVQIHLTQAPKDAVRVVKERGGQMDMVVCSGGDGTLSETIAGMMEIEDKPVLGYIPSGSTNDFASSLRISSNVSEALETVLGGEKRAIDIGRFCDSQYFVYIAGFGAFTEVSYMTPQGKKNLLGHQAYMIEGVKSLTNLRSYYMKVEAEDISLEGEFIFGMITNTISVGGFKGLVTQDVALDDGLFEVLMIRTPKTPMDFSNIVSYMFLREEQNEYVHKFKTSWLHIESGEPVDWVLDGEFGGSHREVTVKNLSKQIEIMAGTAKKVEKCISVVYNE